MNQTTIMAQLNKVFFEIGLNDITSQQQIKQYVEQNKITNVSPASHRGSRTCTDFSQFNIDKHTATKSEDEHGNEKFETKQYIVIVSKNYIQLQFKHSSSMLLMNMNDYYEDCTFTT